MKTRNVNPGVRIILVGLCFMLPICEGVAQFASGSDGSFGELNVTTNATLDLPANGIFHCTTIYIGTNVTLTFRRNPMNTPVYLLATGDITILGTIDVSGKNAAGPLPGEGGPGGFDGGLGGLSGVAPGAGYGPGGGKGGINDCHCGCGPTTAGAGAYAFNPNDIRTNNGAAYGGPLLIPITGGSGGGGTHGNPGTGGGGGGGAIVLASNTRIDISGTVRANGGIGHIYLDGFPCSGTFYPNRGSGGAIRLISPLVAGSGALNATGIVPAFGNGRVRIDTLNRRAAQSILASSQPIASIGAHMRTFPSIVPQLDIIEAAGRVIPVGTNSPVRLEIPYGASQLQPITIQAQNFNADVPIEIVLTPDSGDPVRYSLVISNSTINPAVAVAMVMIPSNVVVTANAWMATR